MELVFLYIAILCFKLISLFENKEMCENAQCTLFT
jgi:hypothetical protein